MSPWGWFIVWWAVMGAGSGLIAVVAADRLIRSIWLTAFMWLVVNLILIGAIIAAVANDDRIIVFILCMVFLCTASRLDQVVRKTRGQ